MTTPDTPTAPQDVVALHPRAGALLGPGEDPNDPRALARIAAGLPQDADSPDARLVTLLSVVLEEFVNHQEQQE
ncbi:hypothetical protein [Acidimangrovimonas pyrenivorans]|uniref:Uncharacterized protein n=1 Tax=Acidimangrovimonas pyrenivorans TaxID=2030798 RepID=A0ABV7AM94_9RHOB